MADDRMAVLDTVRKALAEGDADFLREGVRVLAQAVMEAEVGELTGVPRGERDPERRLTHRNGYRERRWDTRVGTIELAIPRVRDGSYLPSLLDPRRRTERALLAVVQEAYVAGVSTRRVDDLVRALGIEGISRSEVSRMCAALDAEVQAFRGRPLDDVAHPYLWLDATYLKVREGGRVVSMAALVATGVAITGERRILGLELAAGNDEGSAWPRFIRGLVERGLHGVRLVISDDHAGLVKAVREQLLGSSWQRSSVHSEPGPDGPRLAPERRAPWQRRSAEILRQTRASAREASLYRPEGDVPRAPTMSVPGGLRRLARRGVALEGSTLEVFVGLDWGERHHQVHALDGAGATLLSLRVAHDRSGLERLRSALGALGEPSVVGIAIERREGLLVDHLLAWGHPVYPVNPKVAARSREGYRAAPVKSDALDAFALADLLRRQVATWRPVRQPSAVHAELQALVRDRERFVVEHRRLQHQLRAVLETYYPAATKLFSGLHRSITIAFLRRYPTPAEAERLSARRLARFLARQGYSGRTAPEVLVERIGAHVGTPNHGVDAARARAMLALVDLLERVGRVLDEYEAAIAAVLERHPDAKLVASFPGTGLVTTATLVAEIGEDRSRFASPASLLAEAGLAPVTRQSGSSRRVGFRYAANHHLRAAWGQWMLTAIRISPSTREAYDAARARGQSHSRAIRSVGARWGRILWRCWVDRQAYDPALDRRVAMAA